MKIKSLFAALSLAMLVAGTDARASFTYSVAPVTTSTNFGVGSNVTVAAAFGGAASSTLAGTQIINLAQVTQTSTTVQPLTDVGNIALAPLVVTINNLNGGGSGAFTVNGTIAVTRSDTTGAISSLINVTVTPLNLTLGAFQYSLTLPPQYTAPTILGGVSSNGGISILINEVPEPASVALMGLGAALGGLAVLRRRQAV